MTSVNMATLHVLEILFKQYRNSSAKSKDQGIRGNLSVTPHSKSRASMVQSKQMVFVKVRMCGKTLTEASGQKDLE